MSQIVRTLLDARLDAHARVSAHIGVAAFDAWLMGVLLAHLEPVQREWRLVGECAKDG